MEQSIKLSGFGRRVNFGYSGVVSPFQCNDSRCFRIVVFRLVGKRDTVGRVIKLNCFLIAEYAAITADRRVTIAGTFDTLDVQRMPGAPDDALAQIPFPPAYVVAITEASIADGLSHQMRLRVVDGNGQPVTDDIPIAVNYSLNQFGRPMRHNALIIIGLVQKGRGKLKPKYISVMVRTLKENKLLPGDVE